MDSSRYNMFCYLIKRGLRLPFISVSIMPFLFGSLIDRYNFNLSGFIFGLITVIFTHLSANLINDYADSRSGVDWQDKTFYKFFGGSKLIQENILSERFYLKISILFTVISSFAALLLYFNLRDILVIVFYLIIITLSWFYSYGPFRFSYRRFGEFLIFILFGPALVMGGYFIQTGIFPDMKSFLLSLPFGLLTTAVLFVNEVPDFKEDVKAGKFTLVSVLGLDKAFLFYYLLLFLVFITLILNLLMGYLSLWSLLSFLLLPYIYRAGNILMKYPQDKSRLLESSRLTIMATFWISLFLILGVVL